MAGSNPWSGIKLRDITAQCTFSWQTAPTQITAGTFPDSFIDGSHETKLEFYGTLSAAGIPARLYIDLPKACMVSVVVDAGVGAQIGGGNSATREIFGDMRIASEANPNGWNSFLKTPGATVFSARFLHPFNGKLEGYTDKIGLTCYVNTAGDWAFEIYSIRVLELVGV